METGDKWCPSGVCTGTSTLIPMSNDLDSRIKCTLSKLADNNNLSGVVDRLDEWDATQRAWEKLEK